VNDSMKRFPTNYPGRMKSSSPPAVRPLIEYRRGGLGAVIHCDPARFAVGRDRPIERVGDGRCRHAHLRYSFRWSIETASRELQHSHSREIQIDK
jgi:hypothetical protein